MFNSYILTSPTLFIAFAHCQDDDVQASVGGIVDVYKKLIQKHSFLRIEKVEVRRGGQIVLFHFKSGPECWVWTWILQNTKLFFSTFFLNIKRWIATFVPDYVLYTTKRSLAIIWFCSCTSPCTVYASILMLSPQRCGSREAGNNSWQIFLFPSFSPTLPFSATHSLLPLFLVLYIFPFEPLLHYSNV